MKNTFLFILVCFLFWNCQNTVQNESEPATNVEENTPAQPEETDETSVQKHPTKSLSLLEIYHQLDENKNYPITQKGNQFVSQSNAEYEITPIVDTYNGYIEISDSGTGGGNITQQTVLFRKKDGTAIIGLQKSEFDGMFVSSTLSFKKHDGSNWVDATQEVLPEGIFEFANSGLPAPWNEAPEKLLQELFEKTYELPRLGTDLQEHTSSIKLMMKCDGGEPSDELAPWCKKARGEFRVTQTRTFSWDKASGTFSLAQ